MHWFAGVLQSLCSPSKWRPLRLGEQRRKALELLTPPKPARSLRRRHSPRGANHVDGAAPEARLLRRGVAVVAAFIGFCSYSGTFCWAIPTRPLSLPRRRNHFFGRPASTFNPWTTVFTTRLPSRRSFRPLPQRGRPNCARPSCRSFARSGGGLKAARKLLAQV